MILFTRPGIPLPIRGELRVVRELVSISPLRRHEDAPPAHGRTVLLVHGLGAPSATMTPLDRWFAAAGWNVVRAGIGSNIGCSQRHVNRLARDLEPHLSNDRAIVIGHSRGGLLGRALAVQRPDLVSTAVALGAPVCNQFALHAFTLANIDVYTLLGTLGLRRYMTHACEFGPCCERYRASLIAPPPDDVRLVAIYSPTDGLVDPVACEDPYAECLPLDSTHFGMGMNALVWRELAALLAPQVTAA